MKKKQHYVPQFYLKNFAIHKKSGEYSIRCYNKEQDKSYNSNITQVAMERYFYDDENPTEVEDFLSSMEGLHADTYNKIIKEESIEQLSLYEKCIICHYIIIQNERTRSARTRYAQVYKMVYKHIEEEEKFPQFDNFSEEDRKKLLQGGASRGQINTMFNPVEMKDGTVHFPIETVIKMVDLGWILLKNDLRNEFYTSDHPVRVYIPPKNNHREIRGFGSHIYTAEGVEVYFPVTPRLCLVLYDKKKSEYRHFGNKKMVIQGELDFINTQIIAMAYRTVFTKTGDFKFARDCVKENEELKDPNRFRIIHG